jgi:hypothetical protein
MGFEQGVGAHRTISHIVAYKMLVRILWGSLVYSRVGSVTDAHSGTQGRLRDL